MSSKHIVRFLGLEKHKEIKHIKEEKKEKIMLFEISDFDPIIDYHDELFDFLVKYSDSFSLAGHIKDIAVSKKNNEFDDLYNSIMPFLIQEDKDNSESGNEIFYNFKIVPETVLWLKSQSRILPFPMPLQYIDFSKNNKFWCGLRDHDFYWMKIEDEAIQKEFQTLVNKPFNVIYEFMNEFNRLKNSMSEENFIKAMSCSNFENKFFLQQFNKNFYFEKRWNDRIYEFYSDDANLKLFAQILVCRGEQNLTDDDLYFMCFWVMGISSWFKRHLKFDEVFSGYEYVYNFLASIGADRFKKIYLKVIMSKSLSIRLKLLIKIFNKYALEIEDEKLRLANLELVNAYKEWSGKDEYKVFSMEYRLKCLMQICKVSAPAKQIFRSKVLIIDSKQYASETKGFVLIDESNLTRLKILAYNFLYIGTLFYKSSAVKAVFCLDRLANLGDMDCQIDLGKCYLNGIGVKKNLDKAYYWLSKAVDQGSVAAKQLLTKYKFS